MRPDRTRGSDGESPATENERLSPAGATHLQRVDAGVGTDRNGVVAGVGDESVVIDAWHLVRRPVCGGAPVAAPGVRPDDVGRLSLE